jgi:hypothetical protein
MPAPQESMTRRPAIVLFGCIRTVGGLPEESMLEARKRVGGLLDVKAETRQPPSCSPPGSWCEAGPAAGWRVRSSGGQHGGDATEGECQG